MEAPKVAAVVWAKNSKVQEHKDIGEFEIGEGVT